MRRKINEAMTLKQPRGLVLASATVFMYLPQDKARMVFEGPSKHPHLQVDLLGKVMRRWLLVSRVSLNVEIDIDQPPSFLRGSRPLHPHRLADGQFEGLDFISRVISTTRMLNLPVIQKEQFRYLMATSRMTRDIAIGQADIAPALSPDRTLTVEGSFRYHACDDKQCSLPTRLHA